MFGRLIQAVVGLFIIAVVLWLAANFIGPIPYTHVIYVIALVLAFLYVVGYDRIPHA